MSLLNTPTFRSFLLAEAGHSLGIYIYMQSAGMSRYILNLVVHWTTSARKFVAQCHNLVAQYPRQSPLGNKEDIYNSLLNFLADEAQLFISDWLHSSPRIRNCCSHPLGLDFGCLVGFSGCPGLLESQIVPSLNNAGSNNPCLLTLIKKRITQLLRNHKQKKSFFSNIYFQLFFLIGLKDFPLMHTPVCGFLSFLHVVSPNRSSNCESHNGLVEKLWPLTWVWLMESLQKAVFVSAK